MKRSVMTTSRAATVKAGLIATAFAVAAMISVAACAHPAAGAGQSPAAGSHQAALQAAVGSASNPGQGHPRLALAPKPFKTVNLDGSISYPAVGAVVWAAPQGARASISQAKVLLSLKMADATPQKLNGLKPSSIRLVSYENQLGKKSLRGGMIPSVPRQLAWLVEYDNVKHAISLPAKFNGRSAMTSNPWVAVVVISAKTGAVIDAFDYSV